MMLCPSELNSVTPSTHDMSSRLCHRKAVAEAGRPLEYGVVGQHGTWSGERCNTVQEGVRNQGLTCRLCRTHALQERKSLSCYAGNVE